KSVAQTKKALELTFSYPFKDVLKILQIDCTSLEISEDEASPKKHGRKSSDKRYSSLATKIPKFKINKLPPWAVRRDAIRMSSSASGSSSSDLAITLEI
ncbi:19509_t:CDS:2, partial [Dentiscutata erythropus]